MVEVDPMIIAAAGAAMIGLVAMATGACSGGSKNDDKPSEKVIKEKIIASSKVEPTTSAAAADEKSKKKKSKAKKTDDVAAVTVPVVSKVVEKKPVAPIVVAALPTPVPAPVAAPEVSAASKKSKKQAKPAKDGKVVAPKVTEVKKIINETPDDDDNDDDSVDGDAAVTAAAEVDFTVQRLLAKKKEMAISFDAVPQNDSIQVEDWALVGGNKKPKKPVVVVPEKSAKASKAAKVVAEDVTITTSAESAAFADKITTETTIDAKRVGFVIGPKGATKIALQAALNVEIVFAKADRDSSEPVVVSVTGAAECVPKAIKAIQDLCTKGYAQVLEGEDFRETQVSVQPSFLPDIIGKGGANIRAIQDKLQVRMVIPPQAGKDDKTNVKIAVSGLKDNVIKTKQLIKELVQYFHTPITHPGFEHLEMEIAPQYYNYIIGSKGSEIKHIQANFKVQVHIPSAESICKGVLVVGLPSSIESARKYLLKIIDNVEQGRRAASDLHKVWTGEAPAVAAGTGTGTGSEEEKGGETETVIVGDVAGSQPSHEVWFGDLLSNAKRIPANAIPTVGKPVDTSSAGVSGAATGAATGSAPAQPAGWASTLLTSNDGW